MVPTAAMNRSTSAVVNGSRFTRIEASDAPPSTGVVETRMWRAGSLTPSSPSACRAVATYRDVRFALRS
jgi:hypothetical protein